MPISVLLYTETRCRRVCARTSLVIYIKWPMKQRRPSGRLKRVIHIHRPRKGQQQNDDIGLLSDTFISTHHLIRNGVLDPGYQTAVSGLVWGRRRQEMEDESSGMCPGLSRTLITQTVSIMDWGRRWPASASARIQIIGVPQKGKLFGGDWPQQWEIHKQSVWWPDPNQAVIKPSLAIGSRDQQHRLWDFVDVHT